MNKEQILDKYEKENRKIGDRHLTGNVQIHGFRYQRGRLRKVSGRITMGGSRNQVITGLLSVFLWFVRQLVPLTEGGNCALG